MIKKLFLAASALFALATVGQAQELGKLHYRIEGGLTVGKITNLRVEGGDEKGAPLYNFRLGGSLVMPFDNTIFSFNPGLYVIGRGEAQKDNIAPGAKPVKIQSYALQLPLELSFRLATIADHHRIFLNVDPYFAYGLSAKMTRGGDEAQKIDVDLYKAQAFKRFDFGVGANLMYQYKRAYVRGGTEISLLGQVKGTVSPYWNVGTSRYITSYLTVGYEF